MVTPQKNGFLFEDKIYEHLQLTKLKVYREKEIKQIYGKNITAIDHLLYNDDILICIQAKWLGGKVSNSQFNHFTSCVNTIVNDSKTSKYKLVLGLYVSNKGLSSNATPQLDIENIKFNNYKTNIKYYDIYDENEKYLLDKVLYFIHNYKFYTYDYQDDIIIGDYETKNVSYIGDYYNDFEII